MADVWDQFPDADDDSNVAVADPFDAFPDAPEDTSKTNQDTISNSALPWQQELDQFSGQQEIEANAAPIMAEFTDKNNAPIGRQARNAFANFAAAAGSGAADAGAAVLQVGRDLDDAAGGWLPGSRDLNAELTAWLQKRSAEIPKEQGVDPELAESLSAKFGQGLGSMVPVVASGGTLAPVTTAAMMFESGRKDAAASGATPSDQKKAAYFNVAVGGVSERLLGLPALLKSAKAAGMPPNIYDDLVTAATVQAAKSAGREGGQEAIEQTASNLIANSIVGYDPERGTFEGVPEAAFIGALVGGPVGAAAQVATSPRATREAPQSPIEEALAESETREQDPTSSPLRAEQETSEDVPQADATEEDASPQAETDELTYEEQEELIEALLAERRATRSSPESQTVPSRSGQPVPASGMLDAELDPERTRRSESLSERGPSENLQQQGVRGVPQSETTEFVASTQWQEVPEGIVLPNGGIYRMDQASGKVYARWEPENLPPSQLTPREAQRLRVSPESFSASASSRQAPELQPAEARADFARQAYEQGVIDGQSGAGVLRSDPRQPTTASSPQTRQTAGRPQIEAARLGVDPTAPSSPVPSREELQAIVRNRESQSPAEPTPFRREDASNKNIDTRTGQPYALPSQARETVLPETDLAKRTALSRFTRLVEGDLSRGGKRQRPQTGIEPVRLSPLAAKLPQIVAAEAIARRNGRIIIWWKSRAPTGINGGVIPGDPTHIFLNVDSVTDPLHQTVAHEVTHFMQREAPEIYGRYRDAVVANAKNRGAYDENRIRRGYSRQELDDELTADFTAEAISNPARLQAVLGNDPSLWQRVIAAIRDVIERLARRVSLSEIPTATSAISDLRAAHRAMERAWQEWHQSRRDRPSKALQSPEAPASLAASSQEESSQSTARTGSYSDRQASRTQSLPRLPQGNPNQRSSSQREPNDTAFQRQEPSARKALLIRLIDENIDDLLSGKLTKADLIDMANKRSRVTSTKNAVTAQERAERGIPEAQEQAARDFGQVWTEMQAKIAQDPDAARALMDSLAVNPRPVSDLENALLLQQQITLQNSFDAAMRDMDKATSDLDRQEASARLERARDSLAVMYDIDKAVGTELGRGLNARKMMARNDYSLVRMEAEMRARANNGKKLDPKQQAIIKDLHQRIAKAEARLAEYEKRTAPRRTNPTPTARSLISEKAREARERLAQRTNRSESSSRTDRPRARTQPNEAQFSRQEDRNPINDYALIGAEIIENGAADFDSFSEAMVAEFGEKIRPDLKRIYGAAKDTHQRLSKEAKLLESDKRRLRGKIDETRQKAASGDFSKPPKREPRMDKEKADLLFQLAQAREAYHHALLIAERKNRTFARKVFGAGGEVLNTTRAMMTSFDFSAVLRQGGFIVVAHPFRSARALGPMFRAFASKRAEFEINEEIRNRPNAALYKHAKLYLADERAGSTLSKMEEAYASRWAAKIPGIAGSGRAYTTFLNKLRADSFDAMVAGLAKRGKPTLEEAQAIANFVNISTGRGDLGKYATAADLLSKVFFAPRLMVSRFQLLMGQPLIGGTARTKTLIAGEYGRVLAGLAAVYALAAWAQDDDDPAVELDPRSSDFGKLRFGNTRIDPLFGLQQCTVMLSRLATGATKRGDGKMQRLEGENAFKVPVKFLRNKLAPMPASAINWVTGSNVIGEKTTLLPESYNSLDDIQRSVVGGALLPMSSGDIVAVMEEQGVKRGTAIAMVAIFGMSIQTYDAKTKRPKRDKKPTPPDWDEAIREWAR